MSFEDVLAVSVVGGLGYIIYLKLVKDKNPLADLKESMGAVVSKKDDIFKGGKK
jgi:hypothetical protein